MARIHLFEFEDQPWLPAPLRNALTSYLVVAYRVTPFPRFWADRLAPLLSRNTVNEIVDLGSGAGGPLPLVVKELRQRGFEIRATLTDLYPNPNHPKLQEWSIEYYRGSVDATRPPVEFKGIRTMFTSFHHFRPGAAHAILRDAFEHRRPICIFEGISRTPVAILTLLQIPFAFLALTPFVRPVSWLHILFTYVVPILPLLSLWDGAVSVLRVYSVKELEALTKDLRSSEYAWDIGLIRSPLVPGGLPYAIGNPVWRRQSCCLRDDL